jgi:glucose-1-phosphate adenylyltransferase
MIPRGSYHPARRTLAVLLAGGQGTRLYELTGREAKPAIPLVGQTRIVDFTLANAERSGLDDLIVATQYAPATLERHLRDRWAPRFRNFRIRNGHEVAGRDGYLGTADAVAANMHLIDAAEPDEVIVLSGDHIYDMDYGPMIAAHRTSGAVATVAATEVPRDAASQFGVLGLSADGMIDAFVEKPAAPAAAPGRPDVAVVSMGIYVFDWCWLRQVLQSDAETPGSRHDFGHDILPRAVRSGLAGSYILPPGASGEPAYWRDVGTLDALREAQTALAGAHPPCRLPDPGATTAPRFWPVDAWMRSDVALDLVARARGGVLLSAPRRSDGGLRRWTLLDQTAILPGARVQPGARLTRAIIAPGAVVPGDLVVGEDPDQDRRWFRVTPEGTTLVTADMLAHRAAARIHAPVRLQGHDLLRKGVSHA